MPRSSPLPLLLALALPGLVLAQEHPTRTERDATLDDLLERAALEERRGSYSLAVKLYLEVEAKLEQRRAETPDAPPLTEVGPGVDRSVALYLRDRIARLPADALAEYRLTVDPRARAALEEALASRDVERIEAVVARYPLSEAADEALPALADLAFERGELQRAIRTYAKMEARAASPAERRQAALLRTYAAVARGDGATARAALAAYGEHGGRPDAARPFAGRRISPAQLVAGLGAAEQHTTAARATGFDPGGLIRSDDLAQPELPEPLLARLQTPPAYQRGEYVAGERTLYACDGKTVRAIPVGQGRRWVYTVLDERSEPSLLELASGGPALGPGRVYATLHRNRPAKVTLPQEGAQEEEPTVERRKDWRVVALARRSGKLVWDAVLADPAGFEAVARNAEWVSAPLYHESGVYLAVHERVESDLRASLLRLDASTGRVVYRTTVATRAGYDHLGLAAASPAPAVSSEGRILMATGLGAVAAVEPSEGEIEWVARYPVIPESSEAIIVDEGRRFLPQTPLTEHDPLVVAPLDGVEVLALDAATGRTRWRAPRGDARLCLSGPAGEVLLLGRTLEIRDRESGALRFRGPDLGGEVQAAAVYAQELLGVTAQGLVRIALMDGGVLARWRFKDPRAEVGFPVALDAAHLATIGARRCNLYTTFPRVRAAIRKRYDEGPVEALALGEAHAARGERGLALRFLRLALRSGLDQTFKLRAREAAVRLLAGDALACHDVGELGKFRELAEQALEFLGEIPRRPSHRAERDLAVGAAPVLRAYGDLLAASDERLDWTRAAEAFQALLWAPPGSLVPSPGGVRVDARAYARIRLRELVAARGPECYAGVAAEAEAAYRRALDADDRSALHGVVDQFPAAPVAADARWELARSYQRRGLLSQAARRLERFLRDDPRDPRCPEALARLTLLYERLQRLADARRCLQRLSRLDPEPQVQGEEDAPPQPVRVWSAALRERLFAGRSPRELAEARDLAGLEAPLRRVYRSPTELAQEPAELLPLGSSATVRGLYMLRHGDRLELRQVPDGELRLAVPDLGRPNVFAMPTLQGNLLVVPFDDALAAYELTPGEGRAPEELWRVPVVPGETGVQVGPTPLFRLVVLPGVCLVQTSGNECIAIDAREGVELWRRVLPAKADGGFVARGELICALTTLPAQVNALRVADGEPAWSYRPAALGLAQRLTNPVWFDDETLLLVHGSKRIVALNTETGGVRWDHRVEVDADWIRDLLPAPAQKAVVARVQSPGAAGLRAVSSEGGAELWRDDGTGAVRPNQGPAPDGPRTRVNTLALGASGTLYSFRTNAARTELWAQDLRFGSKNWVWQLPIGNGDAGVLLETPTAVLVPQHGVIMRRAALSVLERGTGKLAETASLPGRRLAGVGAVAVDGTAVLSCDRGVVAYARVDDAQLAREVVLLSRALEQAPASGQLRARLAQRLELAGRRADAQAVLRDGILAEGVTTLPYDRMFERLVSLAEVQCEEEQLELSIRSLPRPPAIDGELNDWWRPWSSVDVRGPGYVQGIQQPPGSAPGRWSGDEDLSARLYLGWDSTHFYFALDVSDMNLRPYDSESSRWIGDALLIAIDTRGDGGEVVMGDDLLLSLALTLPRKKDEEEEAEEEENKPEGRYFVRRKEDNSGAVYECAIPWATFAENGAAVRPGQGPDKGFSFGFNFVLTDDDGDRVADAESEEDGARGALKTLELTPSVLLHQEKSRLWQGYIPNRFARITLE